MRPRYEFIDFIRGLVNPELFSGFSFEFGSTRPRLDQFNIGIPASDHVARGALVTIQVALKIRFKVLVGGEAHVDSIGMRRPDPVDLGVLVLGAGGLRGAEYEV